MKSNGDLSTADIGLQLNVPLPTRVDLRWMKIMMACETGWIQKNCAWTEALFNDKKMYLKMQPIITLCKPRYR